MLSKAPLIVALVFVGLLARAQEFDTDEPTRYFVRFGPRVLFNVKAEVEEPVQPAQPWGTFDNGFVRPHIGSAGGSGKTWNWGYDDNSQVQGGQLIMERLRGLPGPGSFSKDEPALGGEIVVGAEIARIEIGEREARIGVEIGYGYNEFSVDDNVGLSSTATLTAFPFDLDGVVPPRAPYKGTFRGPGPLIDLLPSATNLFTSSSQGDFAREIQSDLHLFKLGVWFEYPLMQRLNAAVSVGYASLYADSQFTFSEQFTFANPAIPDTSETHTVGGREWQPGFYAQLRMQYEFHRHLAAYIGADYQYNSDLEFSGEGRKVTLDFGTQLGATAGVIVRF
jgi:hypothetical protein